MRAAGKLCRLKLDAARRGQPIGHNAQLRLASAATRNRQPHIHGGITLQLAQIDRDTIGGERPHVGDRKLRAAFEHEARLAIVAP